MDEEQELEQYREDINWLEKARQDFSAWFNSAQSVAQTDQQERVGDCVAVVAIYIHLYMQTCIHAYIHTCIHACMHTYTHSLYFNSNFRVATLYS